MDDERFNILVVDDGPGMYDFFRDLFAEEEGYEMRHASAFTLTMEEVRREVPDLILFDSQTWPPTLVQPFVAAVRSHPATSSVPIIVCSAALSLLTELTKYCDSQRVFCVAKPFELDDLLRIVGEALQPRTLSQGDSSS